jgi:hypothetical protein
MNSQPANVYPNARIDQVLQALRTTEPPTGLEQRIAARLAQAAEARTPSAPILSLPKAPLSSFAGAKFYTAAALTVIIALTTLALLHNRASTTTQSQAIPFHPAVPTRSATPPQSLAANTRTTLVPRGFSLGSHNLYQRGGVLTPASSRQPDPDAIALAETLAPSRPAPPMSLTPQEQLIAAATRPGQPIQLAELDEARAPVLRAAAQAREDANIQRYIRSMLAPFAVADALSPNNFAEPREISISAPAPHSPISLAN